MDEENRYKRLISAIFLKKYRKGVREFEFTREDFGSVAAELGITVPKNLGDNIYNFRFGRAELPKEIASTAPKGKAWMIWLAGRGKYKFKLGRLPFIIPNPHLSATKIPDATPGLIEMYALTDEQALLARLRYNRLIDIFTGVTCYSLQSHLRTTVPEFGQIETDEVYVGIDRRGAHYVFPVQAKGGRDRISVVQIEQDFALCKKDRFSMLHVLPLAAQFSKKENIIALFAFERDEAGPKVLSEKHYELVSPDKLTVKEIEEYRRRIVEDRVPLV